MILGCPPFLQEYCNKETPLLPVTHLSRSFIFAAASLSLSAQEPTPQKLSTVVIKGSAIGGEVTALTPSLQLSGNALEALSASTLGDVLADIPGVASSYFGPNSGRPVIRGLEGDRLKIAQNGTSSLDASSASRICSKNTKLYTRECSTRHYSSTRN